MAASQTPVQTPAADPPPADPAPEQTAAGGTRGPGPKGETPHTAATQIALGGYGKTSKVSVDGVIWISLKDNNMYHPGGNYWTLWG